MTVPVTYIGWIFAGIPFVFLYNMVAAIMRALGDSKTPLYFLILTSALNIGLDLSFIIPFHMGVLGAALATDISQVISGVLSFIYLSRKFDVRRDAEADFAYSKKACARLLGIGIPMGLQCSITAIGSVIMQWAVNVLGSTAVAAVTAAGKTQGPALLFRWRASARPWQPTPGKTSAHPGWIVCGRASTAPCSLF